jgi:hypothetical protein
LIGEIPNDPVSQYQKINDNTFLFERNNKDNEQVVYEKNLTLDTSNSLSTIVLRPKAENSDQGVYIRLEGYQLILVDTKNGQNLISHFFNLVKDSDYLIKLHQ